MKKNYNMLDTHNKHANIIHNKRGEFLLLADTLLFKIFLDIYLFPAEEFILSLDAKMQAKMFRELELLEAFGNELREPHSKPLGGRDL